jgi:hypothetical protein
MHDDEFPDIIGSGTEHHVSVSEHTGNAKTPHNNVSSHEEEIPPTEKVVVAIVQYIIVRDTRISNGNAGDYLDSLDGSRAIEQEVIDNNAEFSLNKLASLDNQQMYSGSLAEESDPLWINTTSRIFTSSKIYTGQLSGDHFLSASKIKLNWVGSYSNVNREIPSERRNNYVYTKFDNGTVSPPIANFSTNIVGADYPGSIFTSLNIENIYSFKLDISKKVKLSEDFTTEIKIGGITQNRSRDFAARQLGYVQFTGTVNGVNYGNNTFSQNISTLPNETIFNPSNMGILGPNSSGLTLFDGSKGNDKYTASSKLNAGYVMFDNTFKKIRFI